MKFTIAASYLIVLASALAVVSTEATSLRKKESLFQRGHSTDATKLTVSSTSLRRRLEENADGDENGAQDEAEENEDADEAEEAEEDEAEDDSEDDSEDDAEDDAENDAENESEDEDESEEDVEDDAEDNAEGDAEDDAEDGSGEEDDYVFYDDEAIQNCEEGDEDCEKAAAYAAYDEDDLANCEEDDEECNEAAAYMEAKKKQEEETSTTNPWDLQQYNDMYNSMSRRSQIWTIILIVWFSLLSVFTSYLCFCRKAYVSQKTRNTSLGEALMVDTDKKSDE